MKYMLQLQDYNVPKFKGLYIDIEHIESVAPLLDDKISTKTVGTIIHMKSGRSWEVHNELAEVLSKIDDYNEYMKGQTK